MEGLVTGSQRFILEIVQFTNNFSGEAAFVLRFHLCDVIIDGFENRIGRHVEYFREPLEDRRGGSALP